MKIKNLLSLFFLFIGIITAEAQPRIELKPFASGLELPNGIVNAGDSRLFITQKGGLIRILDEQGNIQEPPFLDLTQIVLSQGNEQGLLGLAFHPDYPDNGYFFVNYTRLEDGNTVVARYSVDEQNPDIANPDSEKQILVIEQPYDNHNGGQLLFGPEGYLYIFTGDGGSAGDPQDNAQNLSSMLGKVLRIDINVDDQLPYAIPPDNPFLENEEALDEIWALGLRNPWRNSFDRYTQDLWIADVGQSEREEINFQVNTSPGGENYGWPCYEGTIPYDTEGCLDPLEYTLPVFDYEHQGTGCTGSVTGGYVYRGALYGSMFGYYIFADFCTGIFYNVSSTLVGDISPTLGVFDEFEYTSFGEDQYGELYVTLYSSGEIRRVTEADDCSPVAWIMEENLSVEIQPGETITVEAFYNPILEFQWNKDEQPIEGAVEPHLEISEEGSYTVTVTNPENGCSATSVSFEVAIAPTSVAVTDLDSINTFPNPVTDKLFIEGIPPEGETSISLIDITGKTILEETSSNSENLTLPAHFLPSGLYLLKVNHSSGVVVKRVMVQNDN